MILKEHYQFNTQERPLNSINVKELGITWTAHEIMLIELSITWTAAS